MIMINKLLSYKLIAHQSNSIYLLYLCVCVCFGTISDLIMFGIFLLTVIILTFSSIFLYLRHRSKMAILNLQSRNIPVGKQPSFFSALWNNIRIELISQENIKKIGKVYGWEMFGGINLTIAEPELIQLIMSKEFTNFPNRRVRIII